MVFVFRYLDVFLLLIYSTCNMESTPQKLELITKYFDDFTPTQLEQFRLLEELYKDWNAKINVVSRKDIETMYYIH